MGRILGHIFTSIYYCCKPFPVLLTTSELKQREVPATVSSFYVSVLYTAMLRTSIAAVVLGYYTTWQQKGMYTYLVRIQNFLLHFPFDEIYRPPLVFTLGRSVSAWIDYSTFKWNRQTRQNQGKRPTGSPVYVHSLVGLAHLKNYMTR